MADLNHFNTLKTNKLRTIMATYAQSSSSSRKTKITEVDDGERHLPDDIIDKIFSFLPLRNAFSSGLISKRFSNSWKFSRDLSFNVDYRVLGNPNGDGDVNPREEMLKLVQFVMDEHEGPTMSRLMFILDPSGNEGQVCDWIQKAVSKGVEELDLDFSAGENRFSFPSDMILQDEENARKLRSLKVCYCDIASLSPLISFGHLKKLRLEDVPVPRLFVEGVFSKCLNLEEFEICQCEPSEDDDRYLVIDAGDLGKFKTLKVDNCSYLRRLYISAPSLEVFWFEGEICRIGFANELQNIQKVILHFNPSRSVCLFPGVDEVMVAVKQTKFLSVSTPILERLCGSYSCDTYKESYAYFAKLEEIRLRIGGSRATSTLSLHSTILNPYDIASFLGNCPFIQKLTLDFGVFPLESGQFWELMGKHNLEKYIARFNRLKAVCFVNFKFFKLEMTIAKFILESSPELQKCVIVKAKRYPGPVNQELDFIVHSLSSKNFVTKIYNHNEPYQPY